MANKFKKGDIVEGIDFSDADKNPYGVTVKGYVGEVIKTEGDSVIIVKEFNTRTGKIVSPSIDYRVVAKYFNHYKTTKMAKKKTGGITPKEGMYFTANMNRKKIRGYVEFADDGVYASVGLYGKYFDEESDGDYPTQLILDYDGSEQTFEQALKKQGITSFTVCTDKRQKAVIDGDMTATFGAWRVVNQDGTLIFGCGSVEIDVKDAKTFAEIFCDYGCPEDIKAYHLTNIGDETELEEYYQVRKWLEENWTAAQIAVFNDVLETIDVSGEQNINDLECSEMKALLAKF